MGQCISYVCLPKEFKLVKRDPQIFKSVSSRSKSLRQEESEWLFHLNIRSISKNFDEFKLFLDNESKKSSVICLTETWLQHDADTRLFSLNNFLHMIVNLGHNRNSGVAVYVHESITSEELNLNSTLNYVALKCTNVDRISFAFIIPHLKAR